MQKEFDQVFSDLFGASYFGKLKSIKIQPYVFGNVQRFVDAFFGVKYFDRPSRQAWNISLFFAGELYSDSRDKGIESSQWFTFDKKNGKVWFDEEVFFTLLVLTKRKIQERNPKLKDTGLKDWLKHENYGDFLKQFRFMLSRADLCRSILKGRSPNVQYFRSQQDVLDFVKGSLGKKRLQEIIDICKARSPGGWVRKKGFSTVEGLVNRGQELYDEVSKAIPSADLKKQRITKRKCLRFVCNLALLGTIQSRINEPLSISAEKESKVFTYYRTLRDAACRLRWLALVDESFAPGIRCRSYTVSIMCRPLKKVEPVLMNKIEKRFRQVSPEKKREFAAQFGYNAFEYLAAREHLKFLEDEVRYAVKQNSKIGCAIGKFASENGKLWVHKKFQEINRNRGKREVFYYSKIEFNAKWSDPRRYNWMMYGRAA